MNAFVPSAAQAEASSTVAYAHMLHRDGHHHAPSFLHHVARTIGKTPITNRRVLEIGSGRGLLAILLGLQGAARVVSMEPEMVGATSGVIAEQKRRIREFGLANVVVEQADFNTWDAQGEAFDVIVSRASINHLYASDRHALKDRETYAGYLSVARHIHDLLAPDGVFVATDACRYGFFSLARRYGVRRPWRRSKSGVDWRHHQTPAAWRRIFREAGFSRVEIDYPVPYRLRFLSPLVGTAACNFFLKGSFILRAYR